MSLLPTPRAAAVVALLSVPAALAPPQLGWLVLLNVSWLALLAFDGAAAVSPRRLQLCRRLPDSLGLGQTGQLAWEVHNPTNRAVRIALADDVPPSWRIGDRRARMVVPAHATVIRRQPIRPARRGRFALAELTLRTYGPLGMVARQCSLEVPGTLRVIPAFPSRAATELRLDRSRLLEVGLRSTKGRGGGTDFDQLRDYQVDDDYRRLDWAATARRGHPVVRTYRAERNQQILVLLDTGRVMASTVQGAARLEHALDAIMALAIAASRLGDRVAFMAHDVQARVALPPLDRADRAPLLVDAMVELQPRLVETDYRLACTQLDARFRRRSLVVVLTDLAEAVTLEQLVPAVRLLARRHLVMVAAVADPDLGRWADDAAVDIDGAYRKAAASRVLEQRRTIRLALGQLGMGVLDEVPGRLPLALVDAYLTMKAEQRL